MSLDCYLGSKVSFWHIWPQRPLWSEGAPFPPACNSQLMTYGRRIYLNHWSVLAPQVFFLPLIMEAYLHSNADAKLGFYQRGLVDLELDPCVLDLTCLVSS